MVTAPRLRTSAAHSSAGDGNQAIKIWPAVSLYLLVTWLAAGGLIALQPITHIPTVVVDIVQFAPTTAVLVLMATRRVAAPRIWQGPTSATLRRIAVVFVIMAAIFGLAQAGLAAAGRPVQLTSLRSLGEPFWLIVVIQLVGACGEEFGWRSSCSRIWSGATPRWPRRSSWGFFGERGTSTTSQTGCCSTRCSWLRPFASRSSWPR